MYPQNEETVYSRNKNKYIKKVNHSIMLLPFNCTSSLIPEMVSSTYKEVNFFFNACLALPACVFPFGYRIY